MFVQVQGYLDREFWDFGYVVFDLGGEGICFGIGIQYGQSGVRVGVF